MDEVQFENINKEEIQQTLSGMLAPIVREVAQIEKLKRKEYLTPDEVQILYGLNTGTLANYRSRAEGPEFHKTGEKILYSHKAIKHYLDCNKVRTKK